MTRLNQSYIEETRDHLADIDQGLRIRTGTGLKGVALHTIDVGPKKKDRLPWLRVAVVPITTGAGLIPRFVETLVSIAHHVGLDADVTRSPDVGGLAEAYSAKYDIVIMADDNRFVAINIRSGFVADNDRATGEGFAALLDMMAGGVRGRPCGVIGCGRVGTHAALRLAALGGDLTLCDLDEPRARHLAARLRKERHVQAICVSDAMDLLKTCSLAVEATPSGEFIPAEAIGPGTVITAPGVPLGLTADARERIGSRCYHDNLPLGVATMLLAACYGKMTEASQHQG